MERYGAGSETDRLHSGERDFFNTLPKGVLATIEKGTVKDLVERKLSLIEFGYFDDEDYKNRLMTLRDILFSLEEGYTLKTVEEMYRIKITGVFPEPLGSAISNLMEWEYRNNDKTNWKKAA